MKREDVPGIEGIEDLAARGEGAARRTAKSPRQRAITAAMVAAAMMAAQAAQASYAEAQEAPPCPVCPPAPVPAPPPDGPFSGLVSQINQNVVEPIGQGVPQASQGTQLAGQQLEQAASLLRQLGL